LLVLFVDSLSERDVSGEGAMPKLAARLEQGGLHGPVQPCADAITVPCVTAAITGNDHLSVFALRTNFASGSSAIESSVLGQLQRAGYRAGYLGERILASTMAGLSYVRADLESDEHTLKQLSRTLEQGELDLLIVHLRSLDQTAHKYGEAAPEYRAARALIDAQIDAAMTEMRPSDHVLVMGDHGHTASGRHAAGLDVTTYAAYLGPQFARRQQTPMLMTEHAAIWARLFGFSRNPPGWLDDYYAGRDLGPRTASDLSQSAPVPSWAIFGCVLLACAVSMPWLGATSGERQRALAAFAASVLLMAGLGAAWPDLRAFIWDSLARIRLSNAASVLATGLIGSGLLGWLHPLARGAPRTWQARSARVLTAALVFGLPTVYALGGASVVHSWLALGLFGYALWFGKQGETRRALQLAFACLLVLSVLPLKKTNYVPRGFIVYAHFLPDLSAHALPLVASAFLLCALLAGRLVNRAEPASWLAVASGGIAAAGVGVVSDRWFVVPCSLSLPLLLAALRSARWTPLALACAIPAVWFSYGGSLRILAPVLAVWLLCALLPRVLRGADPALRGAALLSLVLMSFRTAMGGRIAGIDFDFFFRFLPPDADVTAHWVPATLFTTAKYLHTVVLGILLAGPHDAELAGALRVAVYVGRARLGMCSFFLAGLLLMQPAAGAALVGDASQEAALWVLVLGVLAIVSWACQRSAEA
jgi:Type I phosphodiesterase / nucleotide pyrophosphatase